MTRSTKAALLSFFIFPGVGHLYLKRYLAASIFVSTAIITLYFIIDETITIARQVYERILSDGSGLNYAAISEQMARQADAAAWQPIDVASVVLVIVWLGAIADSYRIGRS